MLSAGAFRNAMSSRPHTGYSEYSQVNFEDSQRVLPAALPGGTHRHEQPHALHPLRHRAVDRAVQVVRPVGDADL